MRVTDLFATPPTLPQPAVVLDDLTTVAQARAFAALRPDLLRVTETKGVGKHRGKRYVRFDTDNIVLLDGRIGRKANTKKPVIDTSSSPLVWNIDYHPMQRKVDLYDEAMRYRRRTPNLAARADALFDRMIPAMQDLYMISPDDGPERATWLRVWLTLYGGIRKLHDPVYLYSQTMWKALDMTLGYQIDNIYQLAEIDVSALPPINPTTTNNAPARARRLNTASLTGVQQPLF